MTGTPTEYKIVYRKTNAGNQHTSTGDYTCARSGFAVSGNTNVPIGKITRIVLRHSNTSTQNVKWYLYGQIAFSGRAAITSNTIGRKWQSDVYTMYNTFSTNLPTPEEWANWTSVSVKIASPRPSSGQLYWRANSSYPMEITVYFWSAADLVDGAEPPTVSGVSVVDEKGFADTFDSPLQGQSTLRVTGIYELDPNYQYLTASHTLELTDAGGATLYRKTQNEDSVFEVGALDASGNVTWVYTVLDSAGNSVSDTGTLAILPYTPPSVAALSVQRYVTETDDQSQPVYVAAEDGDHVWISFTAASQAIGGENAWQLTLTYGQDGEDEAEGTTITLQTGADGQSLTFSQDRTLLTAQIDAAVGWWFRVTLTDSVTSTSVLAEVDEAGAYFDVEKLGVAVGMRSKAIPGDRRFEVAEGFEAHFYGGIYGVTNYYLFGHPTGGRWVTGKPLYRETLEIQITAAGTNASVGIDPDTESIVDFSGVLVTSAGAQRPINWHLSSSNYCAVWRPRGESIIWAQASETGTAYVTILYTKATDTLRSFWVYSAEDGHIILAEQAEGSVQTVYDASGEHVNVTATAGETVDFDALTGRITIGGE